MIVEDRKKVVVVNVFFYNKEGIERGVHFDLCQRCASRLFEFANLEKEIKEKEKEVKEGGDSYE